jgi:hypothetical protein
MPDSRFNLRHKADVDEILHTCPGVTAFDLYGNPAWSVDGTCFAFLCAQAQGLAVRVPKGSLMDLLGIAGVEPFKGMEGKFHMREWLLLRLDEGHSLQEHHDLLLFSRDYAFRRAMEKAPSH